MDLQKQYREAREIEANLPRQRVYHLRSLDNPEKDTTAGRVIDVGSARLAADLIAQKTHVLANAEDVAAFNADEERQALELAAIELKRKGQLAMPQELQDLVRLATRAVHPEAPAPPAQLKQKEK